MVNKLTKEEISRLEENFMAYLQDDEVKSINSLLKNLKNEDLILNQRTLKRESRNLLAKLSELSKLSINEMASRVGAFDLHNEVRFIYIEFDNDQVIGVAHQKNQPNYVIRAIVDDFLGLTRNAEWESATLEEVALLLNAMEFIPEKFLSAESRFRLVEENSDE